MTDWEISICKRHEYTVQFVDNGEGCPSCGGKPQSRATDVMSIPMSGLATDVTFDEPKTTTEYKQSKLERQFSERWQKIAPDMIPHAEYKFHAKRKWRFDFAWVDAKELLEKVKRFNVTR